MKVEHIISILKGLEPNNLVKWFNHWNTKLSIKGTITYETYYQVVYFNNINNHLVIFKTNEDLINFCLIPLNKHHLFEKSYDELFGWMEEDKLNEIKYKIEIDAYEETGKIVSDLKYVNRDHWTIKDIMEFLPKHLTEFGIKILKKYNSK